MWEMQGASRATEPWQLAEITTESVTARIVAILQRAADHDVVAGMNG
jgi:hypothetical protein